MNGSGDYSPGDLAAIRECRELLVIDLANCFSLGIREDQLCKAMAKATMPRPVKAEKVVNDLVYLAGLGLVRYEERTTPDGTPYVRWFLTAKGKRFRELNLPWERVEEL